jgi:hypothetical protein
MLNWPSEIKMDFPAVGMRFYPLRENLAQRQKVCDDYLNFNHDPKDRPPHYSKPAEPFVLMRTVNYDRLEIEQIGWLTQLEASFSIPLEWYERMDDTAASFSRCVTGPLATRAPQLPQNFSPAVIGAPRAAQASSGR